MRHGTVRVVDTDTAPFLDEYLRDCGIKPDEKKEGGKDDLVERLEKIRNIGKEKIQDDSQIEQQK